MFPRQGWTRDSLIEIKKARVYAMPLWYLRKGSFLLTIIDNREAGSKTPYGT